MNFAGENNNKSGDRRAPLAVALRRQCKSLLGHLFAAGFYRLLDVAWNAGRVRDAH